MRSMDVGMWGPLQLGETPFSTMVEVVLACFVLHVAAPSIQTLGLWALKNFQVIACDTSNTSHANLAPVTKLSGVSQTCEIKPRMKMQSVYATKSPG